MPPRNDRTALPPDVPTGGAEAIRCFCPALGLLARGYNLARTWGAAPWAFGLARRLLEAAGLTLESLRWMPDTRLVEAQGDGSADAPPGSSPAGHRFLLTPAGAQWTEYLSAQSPAGSGP